MTSLHSLQFYRDESDSSRLVVSFYRIPRGEHELKKTPTAARIIADDRNALLPWSTYFFIPRLTCHVDTRDQRYASFCSRRASKRTHLHLRSFLRNITSRARIILCNCQSGKFLRFHARYCPCFVRYSSRKTKSTTSRLFRASWSSNSRNQRPILCEIARRISRRRINSHAVKAFGNFVARDLR